MAKKTKATSPTFPESITRALSIIQPFAGLVAKGIKPIENRTWSTNYRGVIAIHASSKFFPDAVTELENDDVPLSVPSPANARANWPTRAILGVAEIADCVYFAGPDDEQAIVKAAQAAGIMPPKPDMHDVHRVFFWLNTDCFAWIIRNPIAFKRPIPANGKLNLWYLSDEQRKAVERAVAAATRGKP
jgi:hypothetical protein